MDNLSWLKLPGINNADIARQMGMSTSLFAKKRDNRYYKKFSPQEIERLDSIRIELANNLLQLSP